MQTIDYRGYRITSSVYKDEETGKWVPRAIVVPIDESKNYEETPITWEQEFDTKVEAEDYVLDGIEFYIDENF